LDTSAGRASGRCLAGTLGGFIAVHALIMIKTTDDPTSWLRGDRAEARYAAVKTFLEAPPDSKTALLAKTGPGDYLFHALAIGSGGPAGLILLQLLLQAVTVAMIYAMGRGIGCPRVGTAAAAILIVLPGSLMNPHLLVTETPYCMLLTAATALLAFGLQRHDRWDGPAVVAAFLCLALAGFMRPQTLLIVVGVAAVLEAGCRSLRGPALLGSLLSLALFPLAWLAFQAWVGVDFSIGSPDADLGTNLSLRAGRILSLAGEQTTLPVKIGLGPFVTLALQYPVLLARTLVTDAVNLLFNPGANHVFGIFLQIFPTASERTYWNRLLDESGPSGILTAVLAQGPAFILTFGFMAVLHVVLVLGVGLAVLKYMFGLGDRPQVIGLVLFVTVLFIASVFAAGVIRWAHRSPVEPLLALLAAYGYLGPPKLHGPRKERR
jgi:hypothetical protein